MLNKLKYKMNVGKSTEKISYSTAVHIFNYAVVIVLLVLMITRVTVRNIPKDDEDNLKILSDEDNFSNK